MEDKSIEQRADEKIQEIKDTIAKEHGFNDWEHAISEHVTVSEETINEVARRYAKACQQNMEVSERLYTKEEMEYIKLLKDYIKLLGEELNEVVPIASIHGWKSVRYDLGKELRDKIDFIESLPKANS